MWTWNPSTSQFEYRNPNGGHLLVESIFPTPPSPTVRVLVWDLSAPTAPIETISAGTPGVWHPLPPDLGLSAQWSENGQWETFLQWGIIEATPNQSTLHFANGAGAVVVVVVKHE